MGQLLDSTRQVGVIWLITDDPSAADVLQTLAEPAELQLRPLGSPDQDAPLEGKTDSARYLLVLASPAWSLAREVAGSGSDTATDTAIDTDAALHHWAARARRCLRHLLANRSRCLALDLEELLANPEAGRATVARWIGVDTPAAAATTGLAAPLDHWLLRLCRDVASTHTEATDLHAELLACCEPLPGPVTWQTSQPAAAELAAWQRLHQQLTKLQSDRATLTQALNHNVALEAEVAALQTRLGDEELRARSELATERARVDELKAITMRVQIERDQALRDASVAQRREDEVRARLDAELARHRALESQIVEVRQGWEQARLAMAQAHDQLARDATAAVAERLDQDRRHREDRARWLNDWHQSMAESNGRLATLQGELVAARTLLEADRDRLAHWRNRTAEAERALLAETAARRTATLEAANLAQSLSDANTRLEQRVTELLAAADANRSRHTTELARVTAEGQARQDSLVAELTQLQSEHSQALEDSKQWRQALHTTQEQVEQLSIEAQLESSRLRDLQEQLTMQLTTAREQLASLREQSSASDSTHHEEYGALLAHLHATQELLDGSQQEQTGLRRQLDNALMALRSAVASRPLLWRAWDGAFSTPVNADSQGLRVVYARDSAPHRELVLSWASATIGATHFEPLRLKLVEHQGRAGIGFLRRSSGPAALGRWQPNAREGDDEVMLLVPTDDVSHQTLEHLGASDWLTLLESSRLLQRAVLHLDKAVAPHWSTIAARLLVELSTWPERLRYDGVIIQTQPEGSARVRIEGVIIGAQPCPALQLRWHPVSRDAQLVMELDPERPYEPPLACWPASADGTLQPEFVVPIGHQGSIRNRMRWWARLADRDRLVVMSLMDVLRSVAPGSGNAAPRWQSAADRLRSTARRTARLATLASRLLRQQVRS